MAWPGRGLWLRGLAAVVTVPGFVLWCVRVQRHEDLLLRRRAEGGGAADPSATPAPDPAP